MRLLPLSWGAQQQTHGASVKTPVPIFISGVNACGKEERMRIIESFLTMNPCFKAGKKIKVQGLMIHSVGCPQPKATAFITSWNKSSYGSACVHAFIDANDGTVYQTLPWDHRGWHCGGSGNNTHIGVEMCEPACIKYTSGSSFTCSDIASARAAAQRTYDSAVELFAKLCKDYGLDPISAICSHSEGYAKGIASNHADPQHLWRQLGMDLTMDGFRRDVEKAMASDSKPMGLQASGLKNLTEVQVIEKVGPLFTADMQSSGILASVSLAQFILESGYGKSELALNANNCFGMKKSLSGNTWMGSTWDGNSVYAKQTGEQEKDGSYKTITAEFRAYPSIAASIADHSAYLCGAKNGSKLRYEGLKGCRDYKKAFQIIKDGGYATSVDYVKKLCAVVEKWGLTRFDGVPSSSASPAAGSGDSGTGNSTAGSGSTKKVPFTVRVTIPDLRIREGAGTDTKWTGKYTGIGVFTIVEVKSGKGSTQGWGLLKAYSSKRNGWISLDYTCDP